MTKPPARQDGNALFLILIAVALFAALSYAVTQTGRGGGGNTDRESARLAASQIIQYGADLRAASQRMVLTGTPMQSVQYLQGGPTSEGCPVGFANKAGVECTTGANCLFAPDGGGMTVAPKPPKIGWDETTYVAQWCYMGINEAAAGAAYAIAGIGAPFGGAFPNATGAEAIFWAFDLNQATCQAINDILHIPGIPNEPGGSYTWGINTPGEPAACLENNGWYSFYQVMIEN